MRSTPFDLMSSACFRNPGRCVFEQPGVKEPGTPKITTRLLATSSEKEIGVPSCIWIEIPGADEPMVGPDDIFDKDIKTKEEGFEDATSSFIDCTSCVYEEFC